MDDWGLETTETLLIKDSGPAEALCNIERKLFVKPWADYVFGANNSLKNVGGIGRFAHRCDRGTLSVGNSIKLLIAITKFWRAALVYIQRCKETSAAGRRKNQGFLLPATCMIASKYPRTLPQSKRSPLRVTA